jgi:hypothetical protein
MCVAGGVGEVDLLVAVCERALGTLQGAVHLSAILTATRCA